MSIKAVLAVKSLPALEARFPLAEPPDRKQRNRNVRTRRAEGLQARQPGRPLLRIDFERLPGNSVAFTVRAAHLRDWRLKPLKGAALVEDMGT